MPPRAETLLSDVVVATATTTYSVVTKHDGFEGHLVVTSPLLRRTLTYTCCGPTELSVGVHLATTYRDAQVARGVTDPRRALPTMHRLLDLCRAKAWLPPVYEWISPLQIDVRVATGRKIVATQAAGPTLALACEAAARDLLLELHKAGAWI